MSSSLPLYHRGRPSSGLRRSIRFAIADSIVAQPIVLIALPVNIYLTALFTKGFALTPAAIGCITALPFACSVLQFPVSPFIARWGSTKAITLVAVALQLLAWLALGALLPWIPRDDPGAAAWWLGTLFFLSSIFGAITGVAWMAWLQEWVPPRLLGKFFAQRNRLAQCATLAFLLTIGWILAEFDYALGAFQAIIAVAGLLRVVSFVLLWCSPSPAPVNRIEHARPLAQQWAIVRRSRAFMLLIAFGASWTLAANCFGPFYNVFLLEELAYSAFELSVLSVLTVLGGVLALPAWGRLLDRHGHKSVMLISLLLWQVSNLLWCVLTPANRPLAYLLSGWGGLTGAGFLLGQFTFILKLVPSAAKNFGLATNIALTSVMAAAAPALGGLVLGWALHRWPGAAIPVYHACFVVQPLFALLGGLLLWRLPEPGASGLAEVVATMHGQLAARTSR
jgi:MFS family permease